MSTGIDDVLEAREEAKQKVYPEEVCKKADRLEPFFSSYGRALDFVSENRKESGDIVEKIDQVEDRFEAYKESVEYVMTYREEFGEVDGSTEYVEQYVENLETVEGITESLTL